MMASRALDWLRPQQVCTGVLTGPPPCSWCPDPGLPVGRERGVYEAAKQVDDVLILAQVERFRFAWLDGQFAFVTPDEFSLEVGRGVNRLAAHIAKRMGSLVDLQPAEPDVLWVASPSRLLAPCPECEPQVRGREC